MESLHLLFDVSAVAAALGAGAALIQTRGRLRSAEAKRNALQSHMKEREQATTNVAEADAVPTAAQAMAAELLEKANRRVADLEKALMSAEKQQSLGAQRIEALEKNLSEQPKAAPVAVAPVPVVVVSETPAVRAPVAGAKLAVITVLVGASREAKSFSEIEKHLVEANYKVIRATSTENILTTARDSHPNLVVLDTQISGGDSLTTLENFKADAELREIPIVVVCALKDRDHAIELGAAGCVVPPITSNILLGTVKTAFINHRKRMERSRLAKTANTSSERSAALSAVE